MADNFQGLSAELASMATRFSAAAISAKVFGDTVNNFTAFQVALTNANAVAQGTTDQLRQMTEAARQFAVVSKFSATDVANSYYYLASAGLTVTQALQASNGVMALAQATMSDLGRSADLVASTLSQFNLSATESGRVANVLVAAANTSQATFQKLEYALKQVGPVAAEAGVSLETTVNLLDQLFNVGQRGEQAGTALRNIFLRLEDPIGRARSALQSFGIQVTDSSNRMRNIYDIIKDLSDANPSQSALAAIGGPRSIAALEALITSYRKGTLQSDEAKITDTTAAYSQAAAQLDTFDGAVRQAKNAIADLGYTLSDSLIDPLAKGARGVSSMLSDFRTLDTATQQLTVNLAAFGAAALAAYSLLGTKVVTGSASVAENLALKASTLSAMATNAPIGSVAHQQAVAAQAAAQRAARDAAPRSLISVATGAFGDLAYSASSTASGGLRELAQRAAEERDEALNVAAGMERRYNNAVKRVGAAAAQTQYGHLQEGANLNLAKALDADAALVNYTAAAEKVEQTTAKVATTGEKLASFGNTVKTVLGTAGAIGLVIGTVYEFSSALVGIYDAYKQARLEEIMGKFHEFSTSMAEDANRIAHTAHIDRTTGEGASDTGSQYLSNAQQAEKDAKEQEKNALRQADIAEGQIGAKDKIKALRSFIGSKSMTTNNVDLSGLLSGMAPISTDETARGAYLDIVEKAGYDRTQAAKLIDAIPDQQRAQLFSQLVTAQTALQSGGSSAAQYRSRVIGGKGGYVRQQPVLDIFGNPDVTTVSDDELKSQAAKYRQDAQTLRLQANRSRQQALATVPSQVTEAFTGITAATSETKSQFQEDIAKYLADNPDIRAAAEAALKQQIIDRNTAGKIVNPAEAQSMYLVAAQKAAEASGKIGSFPSDNFGVGGNDATDLTLQGRINKQLAQQRLDVLNAQARTTPIGAERNAIENMIQPQRVAAAIDVMRDQQEELLRKAEGYRVTSGTLNVGSNNNLNTSLLQRLAAGRGTVDENGNVLPLNYTSPAGEKAQLPGVPAFEPSKQSPEAYYQQYLAPLAVKTFGSQRNADASFGNYSRTFLATQTSLAQSYDLDQAGKNADFQRNAADLTRVIGKDTYNAVVKSFNDALQAQAAVSEPNFGSTLALNAKASSDTAYQAISDYHEEVLKRQRTAEMSGTEETRQQARQFAATEEPMRANTMARLNAQLTADREAAFADNLKRVGDELTAAATHITEFSKAMMLASVRTGDYAASLTNNEAVKRATINQGYFEAYNAADEYDNRLIDRISHSKPGSDERADLQKQSDQIEQYMETLRSNRSADLSFLQSPEGQAQNTQEVQKQYIEEFHRQHNQTGNIGQGMDYGTSKFFDQNSQTKFDLGANISTAGLQGAADSVDKIFKGMIQGSHDLGAVAAHAFGDIAASVAEVIVKYETLSVLQDALGVDFNSFGSGGGNNVTSGVNDGFSFARGAASNLLGVQNSAQGGGGSIMGMLGSALASKVMGLFSSSAVAGVGADYFATMAPSLSFASSLGAGTAATVGEIGATAAPALDFAAAAPLFAFKNGGAFGGGTRLFATGDVVGSATPFTYGHNSGVLGEAGEEGILPLKRLSNGMLGVQATGVNAGTSRSTGANNISYNPTYNITTTGKGGNDNSSMSATDQKDMADGLHEHMQAAFNEFLVNAQRPGGIMNTTGAYTAGRFVGNPGR